MQTEKINAILDDFQVNRNNNYDKNQNDSFVWQTTSVWWVILCLSLQWGNIVYIMLFLS